uniref:N-acylneuraminate cytidylyltransferase n=1 Tax=Amblyomma maculatum TaxID=34609 RepID=G3MMH4_AMBMU
MEDDRTAAKKMRVAGLVLARGGSEAVKKKNARLVCGLPLLSWVLRPMKHCKTLDEIWVSTDDQEIEDIAATESCSVVRRSEEFAQGDSPSVLAVHEFTREVPGIDVVALVQCTSPCLVPSYLDEAVNLVTSDKYDSVFSVTRDYKWRWTELSEDGTTRPLNFDPAQRLCRQEWAGEIVESGHFYVTRTEYIQDGLLQGGRCGYVELPQYLCHEVDTEDDFLIVEQKLQKYGFKGDIVLDAPSEFQ